jgi:hypothetical protein
VHVVYAFLNLVAIVFNTHHLKGKPYELVFKLVTLKSSGSRLMITNREKAH